MPPERLPPLDAPHPHMLLLSGGGNCPKSLSLHFLGKAATIKMRLSKMQFFLCFRPTIEFQGGSPVDPLFEPPADPPFDSTSQKWFLSSFRRLWSMYDVRIFCSDGAQQARRPSSSSSGIAGFVSSPHWHWTDPRWRLSKRRRTAQRTKHGSRKARLLKEGS